VSTELGMKNLVCAHQQGFGMLAADHIGTDSPGTRVGTFCFAVNRMASMPFIEVSFGAKTFLTLRDPHSILREPLLAAQRKPRWRNT